MEIGSWKGKSTIWLAMGSKVGNRVKVYAVDPHAGIPWPGKQIPGSTLDDFARNLRNARVGALVVPLVMTSEEAARKFEHPVELIFVDGDHNYRYVKLDFELWFPKLVKGGYIAFHDTNHRKGANWGHGGPKRVAEKYLFRSHYFSNIGLVGSIAFGKRVERNSRRDRTIGAGLMILNKGRAVANQFALRTPKLMSTLVSRILMRRFRLETT